MRESLLPPLFPFPRLSGSINSWVTANAVFHPVCCKVLLFSIFCFHPFSSQGHCRAGTFFVEVSRGGTPPSPLPTRPPSLWFPPFVLFFLSFRSRDLLVREAYPLLTAVFRYQPFFPLFIPTDEFLELRQFPPMIPRPEYSADFGSTLFWLVSFPHGSNLTGFAFFLFFFKFF